jgi:hypothetical protein
MSEIDMQRALSTISHGGICSGRFVKRFWTLDKPGLAPNRVAVSRAGSASARLRTLYMLLVLSLLVVAGASSALGTGNAGINCVVTTDCHCPSDGVTPATK